MYFKDDRLIWIQLCCKIGFIHNLVVILIFVDVLQRLVTTILKFNKKQTRNRLTVLIQEVNKKERKRQGIAMDRIDPKGKKHQLSATIMRTRQTLHPC